MQILNVVLFIVWLISGFSIVMLVLAHSGRGTGVSDMLGSTVTAPGASLSVVEKNLDRLTIVAICIFVLTLLIMMIVWPQAPISSLLSRTS